MTSPQRITLTCGTNAWLATFHDDATILELFGTYTIPTAFTPLATPEAVQASIQTNNPHHIVTVNH